mmetsp:Transcript_32565/g.93387  ORF Transcript_32565/g.93387 Transcript_32565/m.93387 type:complete len:522 (+) Transcript_32565:91-1656(+)
MGCWTVRLMQTAVPALPALLLFQSILQARGDLPVHCVRHQLVGDWEFHLGQPGAQRSSCGHLSPDSEDKQPTVALNEVADKRLVTLNPPNLAQTSTDSAGNWTMIYDEAFEVNVDGLSFLAFSRFDLFHEKDGTKKNVSRCGETQLGWYRNTGGTQWGCFFAKKQTVLPHEHVGLLSFLPARSARTASYDEPLSEDYHNSFAESLNLIQDMWKAKGHVRWVGKTLREMNGMAGIFRPFSLAEQRAADPLFGRSERPSPRISFLQRSSVRGSMEEDLAELPVSWDWRNVAGVNYLDAVLDQGDCGSCYAVATTHMLSARHRIQQNDPNAEAFSINFPLFCSEYNQGCGGGYAFLMARWAQDVGLVPKSCGVYNGSGTCNVQCNVDGLQRKWRASNHHYVGGYYGAASEREMMRELFTGGPLVASFEPKPDIMYYNGGIYKSVPNQRTEWEKVDHAVLLVGYGEERGKKYWVLQNSWGPEWGEDGFFRISRGTDESGIESIVVGADVVEDTRPTVLLEFARKL